MVRGVSRVANDRYIIAAGGAGSSGLGDPVLVRLRPSVEAPVEGCDLRAFTQETMVSLRRALPKWIALVSDNREALSEDAVLLIFRLKCFSPDRDSLKSREAAPTSPIIEEGLRYRKLATELKSVNREFSRGRHPFSNLTLSCTADRLTSLPSSLARTCIPGLPVQALSGRLLDRADEILAEMMDLTARRGVKERVFP